MRHDWTRCYVLRYAPNSWAPLGWVNVFTRLKRSLSLALPHSTVELLPLDRWFYCVSHWTAEYNTDRRVHPAIVQLLAPGGDDVVW